MDFQFIRHATSILHFKNKKILVDPVLSPKGSMTAVENVPNKNNNPLVDLKIPLVSIVNCDAVLVTHTHRDHFDDMAAKMLPKHLPIFCQAEDEAKLKDFRFKNVIPIHDFYEWGEINITSTQAKHGHGVIATKMAPVSGFVITAPNEPCVYLMGDTIWYSQIEKALTKYSPDIVISYCGEARFSFGKAITMSVQDILSVHKKSPSVKIIAVHMEAWNHCRLSRAGLKEFAVLHKIDHQVYIPADGELLNFSF